VLAGRFREDLFYRLSTIQIRVPSLSDVWMIFPAHQYFLKKYNEAYTKQIQGLRACANRPVPACLARQCSRVGKRNILRVLTSVNEFIDVDDLPENLQKPAVAPVIQKTAGGRFRSKKFDDSTSGAFLTRVRQSRPAAHMLGIRGAPSLYRFLKRSEKNPASTSS